MKIIFLNILFLILVSCSSKKIENNELFDGKVFEGVVEKQISCDSPSPNPIYFILINNSDEVDSLATNSIKESTHIIGSQIKFTITKPNDLMICTQDFIPPRQYDIILK